MLNRRGFLAAAGFSALCGRGDARGLRGVKIGVTDWNLKQTGKLEAVGLASRLGFQGVQISLGREAKDGRLPLDNPELISQYVQASQERGVPLDGTCLD